MKICNQKPIGCNQAITAKKTKLNFTGGDLSPALKAIEKEADKESLLAMNYIKLAGNLDAVSDDNPWVKIFLKRGKKHLGKFWELLPKLHK